MIHPFDFPENDSKEPKESSLTRRRALVATLAGLGTLAAGSSATADPPMATTLAEGEEGGRRITTKAIGEEGGPTTRALGEEGGGAHPREIQALANRVISCLDDGDLPTAYELYTTALKKAGHKWKSILSQATTRIEAVAGYETGRAIRILNGEPGNKGAAKEIINGVARMDNLTASRRAKEFVTRLGRK